MLNRRSFSRGTDVSETDIHYLALEFFRYLYILQKPNGISFNRIMDTGLIQVFQQFGKMFFDKFRVSYNGITQWPCSPLHNPVFIL